MPAASTTGRGLSLHVAIEPSDTTGLPHVSYAQCEWVRSINGRRLVSRLGSVDPMISNDVANVVRTLLGF